MRTKTVPSLWLGREGRRLDVGPYLSGALEAKVRLEELAVRKDVLSSLTMGDEEGIYHAGREGRTWVQDPDYGVPFLGSTDILKADLSALPLIANKQVAKNPRFSIHQGWTLITRSGTIGRMAFVRPDMDGMACSEHVMRVVPDPAQVLPGYLYAYLSSKFGVPQIISGTYGAIIQHIEPQHIAGLPVPRFSEEVELRVHELVEEAADARSQAAALREKSWRNVLDYFSLDDLSGAPTTTSFATFSAGAMALHRLDATYHSPVCAAAALSLGGSWSHSKQLSQVARVFTPGIFKRLHVDDPSYGYTYFSGSELFQLDPEPRGYLSKRGPKIREYIVEKDWILLQDAGQLGGLIGRPVRVAPNAHLSVVSNHLMRIAPSTREDAGYIFALLVSPHGYRAITRHSFGSSIPQLDPKHIAAIRIPWPEKSVRSALAQDMLRAWQLEDQGRVSERSAVALVEQTIEEAI